MPSEKESTSSHISISDDAEAHDNSKSGETPRSSRGWDGKLRVEKKLELANPEALSDPEYSDEEQVLPGEEIDADEGLYFEHADGPLLTDPLQTSWTITPPIQRRSTACIPASPRSPLSGSTASKL
jgi:hypothetical protein